MLAKVWSAAVCGIEGIAVSVELDLCGGLPHFMTVGLPDSAVRESRERVASAIRNSGYDFPCRRITVNLAPAELRKRGTQFDLPVALGLLAASGQLKEGEWVGRYCFLGELALDGRVKPVSGVLPMVASAKDHGMAGVVLPRVNAPEAAMVGIASYGITSLQEAIGFVTGQLPLDPAVASGYASPRLEEDISDVKGQSLAKRALEIAAAGGHHMLMVGPPGAGKSMLARRLPGLLPPLDRSEALEIAKILSVSGSLPCGEWALARPFRSPHHTIPPAALIGGGSPCRPGEVSLAHGGVLFLDELAEFKRENLEALRVPLETRLSVISRLRESVEYPASFQLVAAMNPCPCGWRGHPRRTCTCSPAQQLRYRSRLSGPLLDRIDIQVETAHLTFSEWNGPSQPSESSSHVRERVSCARKLQKERFAIGSARTNAEMSPALLRLHGRLRADATSVLESAAERFTLSARSLDRVLRVARTIADIEVCVDVGKRHILEALMLSGRESGRPGG